MAPGSGRNSESGSKSVSKGGENKLTRKEESGGDREGKKRLIQGLGWVEMKSKDEK